MKWLVSILLSLSMAFPSLSIDAYAQPVDGTGFSTDHKPKHDDNGKHKGWKKGKGPHGPKHNPPGHNNHHPNPPRNSPSNRPSNSSHSGPSRPTVNSSGHPRRPGPDNNPRAQVERREATRQPPVRCVRIIKPIETSVEERVIYREVPKTRIEKVLYGASIITAAAVAVGLLMLFGGFIYGWFRHRRDENRFLSSLLEDDTSKDE